MKTRHLLVMTLIAAAFSWLLVSPQTSANPPRSTTQPVPQAAPEGITFHLRDGATFTGKIGIKEISVDTAYGVLRIPVTEVVSLTPGLDSTPELSRKIADLIEKLGSTEFADRDDAQRQLTAMGRLVLHELERHQDDEDNERRTRIKTLIDEMTASDTPDAAGDDEDPSAQPMIRPDTVVTRQFTIVGRVSPSAFTIASTYGSLTIKLADIRTARRPSAQPDETRKNMSVDAQSSAQFSMKSSGIMVERGDKIVITAGGKIVMTPWGRGAVCGPDGGTNYGWFVNGSIPNGALVGRIGSSGVHFKVGSSLTMTADRAGVLQLGFAFPADYQGNAFPGQFDVKIVVRRGNGGG